MYRTSTVLFVVFSLASTLSTADNEIKDKFDRADLKRSLSKNCEYSYSLTCLKLDVVTWVDKLNEDDNYSVMPGVLLVRENTTARVNTANIVQELARSFPNDPEARLDAFLLKKVTGYLNTHSIKLNLWDQAEGQNGESGRKSGGGKGGGGGGGGGMGALLAMGALMKGTLFAVALAGLAAMAGKALMVSLLALMLAAIAGLKGMHGGGGKSTYEVVAKPVYSHEEYGHHGRSLDVPLPLGLQPGYKPA